MSNYRRILRYVRPYWLQMTLAGVFLITTTLLTLVFPWVVQNIVDVAFVERDMQLLHTVTAGLFGLFVVRTVIGFGESYLISWVGERVVANLRCDLYRHLHTLSLRFFAQRRTGEIISRLTNDANVIQTAVTFNLIHVLRQVIMLAGGVAIILWTNWQLTLMMLALVPAGVLVMVTLGRRVRNVSRDVQDALADTASIAEEAISGVRIVKSFAREEYEVERYFRGVQAVFEKAMHRAKVRAILVPVIAFLAFGSITAVLWFGGMQVIQGHLSPGQLISFLLYTMLIASPIAQFTSIYSQFQEALGATDRIFELLDTSPDLVDLPGAAPLAPARGRVRFDNVSFAYSGDRAVLHNVNLEARPGQVIALVGPSGAGKTTLVNLIPRFYDPSDGRILIDGYDIRAIQLASLRQQVGLVPQEVGLFSGTIRENIAYGRLDASDAGIEAAARAANAHEFIAETPQGYDTLVGERGTRLSGGQRQRIAIARAILKDPRILILDEATSSLDSASEAMVQEALERLMRDRTTFVIAHRLSTITNADWIAVLDKGRVVEQGTHADLLALEKGLYRRLHALQFDGTLFDLSPSDRNGRDEEESEEWEPREKRQNIGISLL